MDKTEILIETGDKIVIASPRFFTEDLKDFAMRLTYQEDYVDISFIFISEEQNDDNETSNITAFSPPDNPRVIGLVCKNFDSIYGTYNRTIYKIGKIGNNSLYLRSRMARPYKNAEFREIGLTFYVDKSGKNND